MSDTAIARGPARRSGNDGAVQQVVWRLLPLTPFVLILLAWVTYWAVARPSAATLPAVQDVAGAMWELAVKGELAVHVLAGLWRLLLGVAMGVATGVIGGFIVGLNRPIAEFLSPLIVFFNAISGIVVLGALQQVGSSHWLVVALASLSFLIATINIVGGFLVTRRMLAMFQKS